MADLGKLEKNNYEIVLGIIWKNSMKMKASRKLKRKNSIWTMRTNQIRVEDTGKLKNTLIIH